MDYRDLAGERFDAIASIGMVEHVGAANIDAYAQTLAGLLEPGGRLLNHGIARLRHGEPEAGPFSERYVFPDAAPLHLSRVPFALERAGFEPEHVEGFRLDYARTLREWTRRLEADHAEARAAGRRRAHARLAGLPAGRPARLRDRLHVDLPGARREGVGTAARDSATRGGDGRRTERVRARPVRRARMCSRSSR